VQLSGSAGDRVRPSHPMGISVHERASLWFSLPLRLAVAARVIWVRRKRRMNGAAVFGLHRTAERALNLWGAASRSSPPADRAIIRAGYG
jgi:hypothetical protein